MISLDQVQLLEARVSKAIEYLQRVNAENAALVSERDELKKKLSGHQKRIDELEVLVMRFKEDQGRIEDGILAALDRLSQFEEAFENSLKDKSGSQKTVLKAREEASLSETVPAESAHTEVASAELGSKELGSTEPAPDEVFFEIKPEDTQKQSEQTPAPSASNESTEAELEIF